MAITGAVKGSSTDKIYEELDFKIKTSVQENVFFV